MKMPKPKAERMRDIELGRFKKGCKGPYATYLNSLTPEQYAAHLEERKKRKELKKGMEPIQKSIKEFNTQFRDEWATSLLSGMVAVMRRAINNGDPAAMVAVWDRLVGKPGDNVDLTSKGEHINPTNKLIEKINDDDMVTILMQTLSKDKEN